MDRKEEELWFCQSSMASLESYVAASVSFLKPYSWLWRCHVVELFTKKHWEKLDITWLENLQNLSPGELLQVPSGLTLENWPESLKEFVTQARKLSFPRIPGNLEEVSISSVAAQGMNPKKRHEISRLAALVANTAKKIGATHVIDFGAGQGYLAIVLAFHYGLHVLAIDTCSHHGTVTEKRGQRLAKYYSSPRRASQKKGDSFSSSSSSSSSTLKRVPPVTVTKHVDFDMPSSDLGELLDSLDSQHVTRVTDSFETETKASSLTSRYKEESDKSDVEKKKEKGKEEEKEKEKGSNVLPVQGSGKKKKRKVVLVGLHACGDLSANLVRAFVEWEDAFALVSIGCCYNMLSEQEETELHGTQIKTKTKLGYPLSSLVRSYELHIGRNGRDLACQSAERWGSMDINQSFQNFEMHIYRAVLQMVLLKYFPSVAEKSPSVGRLGKSMIRKTDRKKKNEKEDAEKKEKHNFSNYEGFEMDGFEEEGGGKGRRREGKSKEESNFMTDKIFYSFSQFLIYAEEAFNRLNLEIVPIGVFEEAWNEVSSLIDHIAPFWTLRAVISAPLETLILVDRLVFLLENELNRVNKIRAGQKITKVNKLREVQLIPLFDPIISPRNVALVAIKDEMEEEEEMS